ncbi:MAG: T9SS type A sorting domain-containing protein [bacterium]
MKKVVIAAVLAIAAASLALELPAPQGDIHSRPRVASPTDRDQPRPETERFPAWVALERMNQAERDNSRIELELPGDASPAARAAAAEVTGLWNRGRYDEARAAFHALGGLVDPCAVTIGNSWRTPVPTYQTCLWGDDVRIGNRDTISLVELDIHRASGNLFAVLAYREGTGNYWSVNLSTNGGVSWTETYTWFTSLNMYAVSAAVLTNYCYVVYDGGVSPNRQARVRRFRASTGADTAFGNGSAWLTIYTAAAGDSVKEISLVSSQDTYNDRIYCFTLLHSGAIKYIWSTAAAATWDTIISTGVTNADRGLDACFNAGAESSFIWLSYYDTLDNVRITARRGPGFRVMRSIPAEQGEYTSIGAYHDTILCAFDYEPGSLFWVQYFTNYQGGNPGSTWFYGNVGNDTTTGSESPDVAMRAGGGQAIIYRHYTPTREMRYTWRDYAGPWTTPVAMSDHQPYWNRPAIEFLGSAYGVVYLRRSNFSAYFDRTDWSGVAEQRRLVMADGILSVAPNPLTGRGQLTYTLNRPARLAVRLYDRGGRAVRTVFEGSSAAGRHSLGFDATGLAPGVYFVRADADGTTLTVPVTVVK